jgi:hypothetical protein
MPGANPRDSDTSRNAPSSQTGSDARLEAELQDIAESGAAAASPDMNQDPLAGALGQDSLQDDTLVDAVVDDTGLPARNDPAPAGGPGSKNTSAPAGEEIGQDEPTEGAS